VIGNYDNTNQRDYMSGLLQAVVKQAGDKVIKAARHVDLNEHSLIDE
jgi:hypothetical protein